MHWHFHRRNILFGAIAWMGILQFLIAVGWAMSYYPDGYRFASHFLSDLGRRLTPGGRDNAVCALVFCRSAICLGMALMPFFTVMAENFSNGRFFLRCCGLLSAAGLMGIGLTPLDDYFVLHHVALAAWIGPMAIMVVLVVRLAWLEGADTTWLTVVSIGIVIVCLAYALAGDHHGYVIVQKILVCLSVLWFGIVFLTVSIETVQSMSYQQIVAEAKTQRYLQRIQHNHRQPGPPRPAEPRR